MAQSRWVWSGLRWSGLPFLMRETLQRRRVTILCYHDPDPAALSHHLETLTRRYNFVALRDYVDARLSGRVSVLPDRALVITLDDGHMGNSRLLDVFQRHGVRPTIFLASGIVGTTRGFWWQSIANGSSEAERLKAATDSERVAGLSALSFFETQDRPVRSALSRGEIEAMAGSVDFQAHTVLHPILSRCSDERAWAEIAQSRTQLEREYALDIYALAYPNGSATDWGQREVDLAERAGYTCALSAIPGGNDASTDVFRIARIVVPDDASCDELIVRASLLHKCLRRLVPVASH